MHCNISSVVEFLALGVKISLVFIEKMNVPKAFFFILKTDIGWGLQKLGIVSEYEVPLNLKLVNNVFIKSC